MLDRAGSRVVVVLSTALIAAGMGMVAFFTATLTLFYAAGILIGLGMAGLLGSALRYVMLNEAPRADRGAAQGILTVFISIGQLAGAAVLGAIIASTGGRVSSYADAFLVVAILAAALTAASLGLKGRAAEQERMD